MASPPLSHGSLFDDLQESDDAGIASITSEGDIPASVTRGEAHIDAAHPNIAARSPTRQAEIPSNTPLARYMAKLNGAPVEDEATAREQEDEDPHDAASIDEQSAAATSASSSSSSASSSSWRLASEICLEIAAPSLVTLFVPRRTLSWKSKQWCLRTCIAANEEASEENTSAAEQRGITTQQIAQQAKQIHRIYMYAFAVSLLQLVFFCSQMLMHLVQPIFSTIIVPILLSTTSTTIVLSPVEVDFVVCLWTSLTILSVVNLMVIWVSLHRESSLRLQLFLFSIQDADLVIRFYFSLAVLPALLPLLPPAPLLPALLSPSPLSLFRHDEEAHPPPHGARDCPQGVSAGARATTDRAHRDEPTGGFSSRSGREQHEDATCSSGADGP